MSTGVLGQNMSYMQMLSVMNEGPGDQSSFGLYQYNPFFLLKPKFQTSSHLLCVNSLVCVRPGRKPRRPVFSLRGSFCCCCIRILWPINTFHVISGMIIYLIIQLLCKPFGDSLPEIRVYFFVQYQTTVFL